MADFQEIGGGVTAAAGFRATGVSCGIKESGKKDLALVYSEAPAAVAAAFTSSKLQGAPIVVAKKHVKNGRAQAVVINSGCANTCTGPGGVEDAIEMAKITGKSLNLNPYDVVVASTGVIGTFLPLEKVKSGIERAAAQIANNGGRDAANAIMTTDSVPKEAACRFHAGQTPVAVGGMAKGAGMIAPKMVLPGKKEATMLAVITTDAVVDQELLKAMLSRVLEQSFNRVTVDGETSPNDMAVVLANGEAGNEMIVGGTQSARDFEQAFRFVAQKLAKKIVEDAEGATKLIVIEVAGAANRQDAEKAAFAVANSPLVKTAFFGEDANWGRIMTALGHAKVAFSQDAVDIYFGDQPVVKKGMGVSFESESMKTLLGAREIRVTIDLHQGDDTETVWTSDFTYDYVKVNAEYRT